MSTHSKGTGCLLLLAVFITFNTATSASEIRINGLPCNELCQSWMISGKTENFGSIPVSEPRSYSKNLMIKNKHFAAFHTSRNQRSKTVGLTFVRPFQAGNHTTPMNSKPTVSAKLSLPIFREAKSRMPVPILSNATTPKVSKTPHKIDAAAPTPDTGLMPLSPNSKSPAPSPEQSARSSSQAAIPKVFVAPSSPTVSRSSDVVASISSPVDARNGSRDDDRPSGKLQHSILQPIPELAGKPLPVTVGQITVEPRGTDVHVVLVNILQQEIKDVDVMCRARDAQGMQVAEAFAHIATIAPLDVAFGQVILPNEIKISNSKITCEIGKFMAANNTIP